MKMHVINKTMQWTAESNGTELQFEAHFVFQLEVGEQDGDQGVFVRNMETVSLRSTAFGSGIDFTGEEAHTMAGILIGGHPDPEVRAQFDQLTSEACAEAWEREHSTSERVLN